MKEPYNTVEHIASAEQKACAESTEVFRKTMGFEDQPTPAMDAIYVNAAREETNLGRIILYLASNYHDSDISVTIRWKGERKRFESRDDMFEWAQVLMLAFK